MNSWLKPSRIAFIYAVFGTTWILVIDWLTAGGKFGASLFDAQSTKGLLFVALTALLVFVLTRLMRRGMLRAHARQKNVEKALRESEARFREMAENIYDVFYNYDQNAGRIMYVSPAYSAIWGVPVETLLQDPVSYLNAVHPEDRPRVAAVRGDHEAGRRTDLEYRIVRPDGTIRWIRDRAFPVTGPDGKVERTVGVARDITARHDALAALERHETDLLRLTRQLEAEKARLEAAQAVAKIGSWETDLATLEVTWSLETFRIFGLDSETFTPRHDSFLERVHPDDKETVDKAFVASFASSGTHTVAHRIILPDGGIRHVEENWRVERAADGTPLRAHGTCQDISERVRLEDQFRQSQKMEAVGRLAGGVAHDFNNMLTVILVRTEQALKRAGPDSPLHAGLKEIYAAAERSAGLTRQLLTYARRQAVQPRTLDLNEVVEGMLGMLRRLIGEDISLEWNPGHNLWPIRIDPIQIDQLLANLCVNARDAIDDVGRIVIETRNASFDEEYCKRHAGSRPGSYVMLAVSDDGCGMDKATLAHVFEPFFTTKEVGKGTGLGLPTVYGIVQQNHGFIQVYSEPGQGTTFRIYLERFGASVAATGDEPAGEPPHGAGETVLLVEDEAMILDVTAEMLEDLGYKVLRCGNPDDALALAATPAGKADLLLTDLVMPGMNGRDLAERISALQPGIRRVFMSGYTAGIMPRRGTGGPENLPYLQKPFSSRELAGRLREALAAPGPGEQGSGD